MLVIFQIVVSKLQHLFAKDDGLKLISKNRVEFVIYLKMTNQAQLCI